MNRLPSRVKCPRRGPLETPRFYWFAAGITWRVHAGVSESRYHVVVTPFERAEQAFEASHRQDPRPSARGPRAVIYYQHVAKWVDELDGNAPEVVRLAARCQHIRRWALPRSEYPLGRSGYKQWRSKLAQMHAQDAAEILTEAGYEPETATRVGDLLIKKGIRQDPEVQLL